MAAQSTAKRKRRTLAGVLFVLLAIVHAVASHASLPSLADPIATAGGLSDPVAGVGFLLDGSATEGVHGAENRVRGYHPDLASRVTLGPALSLAFTRAYLRPRSSAASGGLSITTDPLGLSCPQLSRPKSSPD